MDKEIQKIVEEICDSEFRLKMLRILLLMSFNNDGSRFDSHGQKARITVNTFRDVLACPEIMSFLVQRGLVGKRVRLMFDDKRSSFTVGFEYSITEIGKMVAEYLEKSLLDIAIADDRDIPLSELVANREVSGAVKLCQGVANR